MSGLFCPTLVASRGRRIGIYRERFGGASGLFQPTDIAGLILLTAAQRDVFRTLPRMTARPTADIFDLFEDIGTTEPTGSDSLDELDFQSHNICTSVSDSASQKAFRDLELELDGKRQPASATRDSRWGHESAVKSKASLQDGIDYFLNPVIPPVSAASGDNDFEDGHRDFAVEFGLGGNHSRVGVNRANRGEYDRNSPQSQCSSAGQNEGTNSFESSANNCGAGPHSTPKMYPSPVGPAASGGEYCGSKLESGMDGSGFEGGMDRLRSAQKFSREELDLFTQELFSEANTHSAVRNEAFSGTDACDGTASESGSEGDPEVCT